MRLASDRRSCLALVLALGSATAAHAAVFTVTTVADSGAGSLREALTAAIAVAGPHTIEFNIPGAGPHSIALASSLPTIVIVEGLTIDGTTQPGYTDTPLIEIHSDTTGSCLNFQFTPATVKALAINRCSAGINSGNGGSLALTGSRIGTDPAGVVNLGNQSGVILNNGGTNTIGGPLAADRNVISGSNGSGISLGFGSTGAIRGNYIGVDATGAVALPNGNGIYCENGNGLVVGGSAAGEGNVISGSIVNGLQLQNCQNAVVRGNLIGTNAAATAAIPNNNGITTSLSNGMIVGGTLLGEGNVISGNTAFGLYVGASDGATIQGNLFGTDPTLTLELGSVFGVQIGGADNLFGTSTPGGPGFNVVAYNQIGVFASGEGNTIRGNAIYGNKILGLDTSGQGVNWNDAGDADFQAQNFPNIDSAVEEGAGVRIIGRLESMPSQTFDLDFYENPACSRFPQDYLQGPEWLGATQVTTDGTGHATFNVLLSPADVEPGFRVTATATDSGGSTSEFTQRIVIDAAPLSGEPTGQPITLQGFQFEAGATVTVGGVPATNVQVQNANSASAQTPSLPPGTINHVTLTNPSGLVGTIPNAFVAMFSDVPLASGFAQFIGGLVANGLTVGCGGPNYCPLSPVTRQQMAVFLLRGKLGLCYTPPPCTGTVFDDVPCAGNSFAPWVEALAGFNITGGCGGNNYCPTAAVNRQQMAVFLLKALEGSDYVPPACTVETFDDVPCSNPFAPWIYELAARGVTSGCGGSSYCPTAVVTRQQMAAFLVRTFTLPYI